ARGDLRLLLSGPSSSAGRPMPDGRRPAPGGWNRIHLIVEDLAAEVDRLRAAGVHFRNDIVTGPGGSQILLDYPSGHPIELFQRRRDCPALGDESRVRARLPSTTANGRRPFFAHPNGHHEARGISVARFDDD